MVDEITKMLDLFNEYQTETKKIISISETDLKKIQSKKIRDVVNYVKSNSIFYKEKFKKIDASSIDVEKLKTLPYTTKEDLAESQAEILSKDIRECAYYYETTGTTGPATPCPRGYLDTFINAANVARTWKGIFGNSKPIIGLMGPNEIHSFVDTVSFASLINQYCVFKIWPLSPVVGFEKAISLIKKYKIDTLVCTPGMAMRIYKYMIENSLSIKKDFSIKTLIFTGEMMTEGLCRNISSLYDNALVLNGLYGSQEGFVMAAAGSDGKMYTFPNCYYYETITVYKDPIKEYKELVLTMFHRDAKPLVRFRTGDLVEIGKIEKDNSQMIKVIGRLKDIVHIGGIPYCPSEIENIIFRLITRCLGYRIELHDDGEYDLLKLYLQFEKKDCPNKSKINEIKEYISSILKINVEICIDQKMSDDIHIGAMYGWKTARFKDLRRGV